MVRDSKAVAAAAALLAERGHTVAVARDEEEAAALVRAAAVVLLVDAPCLEDGRPTLCSRVLEEVRPLPTIVGVLGPGQQKEAERCARWLVPVPCHASVAEIVAVVESAAAWWPGDV